MTKENYTKTMRLVGALMACEKALDHSASQVLISDARTRDLIGVAGDAIKKAIISAWDKAESEPVEESK